MGPDHTVISFRAYARDPSLRSRGAGSALHRVEMEDEEVVESCMRGVRSRLYDRGRYSPRREIGTTSTRSSTASSPRRRVST